MGARTSHLREVTGSHDAGEINFRGHIVEFDGLRAIGLILVLTNHIWLRSLSEIIFQIGQLGWMAMDSFFVMSGLLITGILLDSRDKPRYYSNYYIRRALRIFPLYYLVLLIWWYIIRYTNWGNDYRNLIQVWGSPAWFTFYAGNIREAMVGSWPSVIGYTPLWSLQIEEQYYLLFPLAVALLSREHLRRFLLAAICLSPVLRVLGYLWQPHNFFLQFVLLPCHCDGLAMGGLLAIRLRSGPWKISKFKLTLWTLGLLGSCSAISFWSKLGMADLSRGSVWDRLAGFTLSSAGCTCLVLWLICFRNTAYTRWIRIAPLQYLGKISYGVYLLHSLALWIIFELVKKNRLHFRKDDPIWVAEVIALSIAMSAVSWKFFESPVLKLKEYFAYKQNPRKGNDVVIEPTAR